jgi:N-acetylglutamate synthase-like GNAT family acetyltransferase
MCYTTLRKMPGECRKVAQVTILEVSGGGGEMALRWVHDDDPRWDDDRRRVFASVPQGVLRTEERSPGEPLSSDWWRVERDGRVVGYGWLDDVWGDAEVLLAVDAGERGSGVGSFVMAHLEQEAAARGLNYVVNVVRQSHPARDAVTAWLQGRGFSAAEDGRLRKRVGTPARGSAHEPDSARHTRYAAERDRVASHPHPTTDGGSGEPMGPGHEESGGYVDVERHRF